MTTKEVKRWTHQTSFDGLSHRMIEFEHGEYVRFCDYIALRRDCDRHALNAVELFRQLSEIREPQRKCKHKWETRHEGWHCGAGTIEDSYEVCIKCETVRDSA